MLHSIRKRQIFYIFILALILGAQNARAADADADADARGYALLIYGSGGVGNWDQSFNASLSRLLGSEFGQYFTPEYLPLITAQTDESETIADSLALKHSNKRIGLVVALLEEANVFVKEWGHVFAPEARVISVLPSDEFFTAHRDDQNTIFVTSAIDAALAQSTALYPRMLPELERIYVIGGAGAGDAAYMNRYLSILRGLQLPYELNPISGLTPDELIAELSSVPPNSAVMTTTYDLDRLGTPFRSLLITERLAKELDMPVLAMSDPQIPAGAIGGKVTSVDAYARTTRELIQSIVADQSFVSEPVSAETDFLFNGEQLDRFDISRSTLPAGSVIVNEVPDIWRDYGFWILPGLALIIIQGFLIAGLLHARRKRLAAEASLKRAHKMEALGTLAGGIAHDFNNVLMSITANTELIGFQSGLNPAIKERLNKILAASQRAKNLVTQILMFSRQSHNSVQQSVELEALVKESIEQLQTSVAKSCAFKMSVEDELPAVQGDQSQLFQLIMNVCLNAQQAMAGRGTITIEIRHKCLKTLKPVVSGDIPPGDYVELTVIDTGTGIDPNDLQHVFEPFFTTKSQGEGTGLGLALVSRIVKSHQGFVDLTSQPGLGTTVSVYLPALVGAEDKDEEDETIQIVIGNNQRVMLVDDDELVLDSSQQIFRKLGYKVTAFKSSVAAMQAFKKNPYSFDLVFSDISMPEMDGIRLLKALREIRPEIAGILFTGYLDAYKPGDLDGFQVLSKPSSAAEISQAVEAEFRRRSRHNVSVA